MSNKIKNFEAQHRHLMFRAENTNNDAERKRHQAACDAAIEAMQAGDTDATALWAQYPADLSMCPVRHIGRIDIETDPETYKLDGADNVLNKGAQDV